MYYDSDEFNYNIEYLIGVQFFKSLKNNNVSSSKLRKDREDTIPKYPVYEREESLEEFEATKYYGIDLDDIDDDYEEDKEMEKPQSSVTYIQNKELELMKLLYSKVNSILYPYVVEVLKTYDYEGSPIYDKEGVDRETLAQIVNKVITLAYDEIDGIQEIYTDSIRSVELYNCWNKQFLIRGVVESLVLTELFTSVRPSLFIY